MNISTVSYLTFICITLKNISNYNMQFVKLSNRLDNMCSKVVLHAYGHNMANMYFVSNDR